MPPARARRARAPQRLPPPFSLSLPPERRAVLANRREEKASKAELAAAVGGAEAGGGVREPNPPGPNGDRATAGAATANRESGMQIAVLKQPMGRRGRRLGK